MDYQIQILNLQNNTLRIRALVENLHPAQVRWKPKPDQWSILEVINHLVDEERYDFKVRLDIILHHPEQEWPKIDPQGWVTSHQYNQAELDESIENFLLERQSSLEWLRSLNPDLDAIVDHPLGSMRAGDMFAAWISHDWLHIRQLVELHYAYLQEQMKPYASFYAGDW